MQAIRKYNCSYFSVGRDSMIKFDNSQLLKLQDNFSKLEADLRKKVCKQIAQSAGRSLLSKTIEKTPVDTNWLREHWSSKQKTLPDGFKITVFNPVRYSEYVEYGHRTRGKAEKEEENASSGEDENDKYKNPRRSKKTRRKSSSGGNARFIEGRYMLTKSTEEVASTIAARGKKFIEQAIKERLNDK